MKWRRRRASNEKGPAASNPRALLKRYVLTLDARQQIERGRRGQVNPPPLSPLTLTGSVRTGMDVSLITGWQNRNTTFANAVTFRHLLYNDSKCVHIFFSLSETWNRTRNNCNVFASKGFSNYCRLDFLGEKKKKKKKVSWRVAWVIQVDLFPAGQGRTCTPALVVASEWLFLQF